MKDSKIIEKLRKLQALSESSNENEAELALHHLQKLMEQHNIETIEENISIDDIEVDKEFTYEAANLKNWRYFLARACAKLFDCKIYESKVRCSDGRKYTRIYFVGTEKDRKLTIDIYHWLADVARSSRYKAKREDPTIRSYVYYEGFWRAVDEKVDEILEQRKEIFASNSNALVVVNKKQEQVEIFFAGLGISSKNVGAYLGNGYDAGYSDGSKVNIGNQVTGNSVGQQLLR